jgi:hypothetical protein
MEMRGQLHTVAALLSGKVPPVPSEVWVPEGVWKFSEKTLLPVSGIDSSVVSPVAQLLRDCVIAGPLMTGTKYWEGEETSSVTIGHF